MIISNHRHDMFGLFNHILASCNRLHRSTRDEEPLVDAAVNRSRRQFLVLGDVDELRLGNAVSRGLVGDVGQADLPTLDLAGDQLLPGVGALADDILSVSNQVST